MLKYVNHNSSAYRYALKFCSTFIELTEDPAYVEWGATT